MNRHSTRAMRLFALAIVGVAAACSSSEDAPRDVAFTAQAAALPGFSYDTGLQPASGPAQMSLKLAAEGSIIIDQAATATSGAIAPKPSAGSVKLDVHVKLAGTLKVDAGAVKYDGPLPGLSAVDVPIVGQAGFDGFLLDGPTAEASANIPETKLPDVPLGTVPGHLSITVMGSSKLTTSFKGTCVAVQGGKATYSGSATTSGSLVLKSQLVLDLPLVKPIDLPEVTVPIPGTVAALTSAPVDVSGTGDTTMGTCGAPPDADAGPAAPPDQDGSSGGGDGGAKPDGDGVGELICANESTFATCSECCAGFHPGGKEVALVLATPCLCQPAYHCATECGSSVCKGLAPNGACQKCIDSLMGNVCLLEAVSGCAAGSPCAQYKSCLVNTACTGKAQ